MAARAPTQGRVESGEVAGNDVLIADALKTLGDPVKGKKWKPTLVSIKRLTKLSMNTIRRRVWALDAIDALKTAAKKKNQASPADDLVDDDEPIVDPEVLLSRRFEGLLKQNGLLYEEILHLRREIRKRDEVIENLQGGRLRPL